MGVIQATRPKRVAAAKIDILEDPHHRDQDEISQPLWLTPLLVPTAPRTSCLLLI